MVSSSTGPKKKLRRLMISWSYQGPCLLYLVLRPWFSHLKVLHPPHPLLRTITTPPWYTSLLAQPQDNPSPVTMCLSLLLYQIQETRCQHLPLQSPFKLLSLLSRHSTTMMRPISTTTPLPPSTTTTAAATPSYQLQMEGVKREVMRVRNPSIPALTVANTMRPAAICPDIDRLTAVWTLPMLKSAIFAAKCMSVCLLSVCTYSHTISIINVNFVEKLFPGPGCCRVIYDHTLETSHIPAMFVESLLLTDLIWEHICKLIHQLKTFPVCDVKSPLH